MSLYSLRKSDVLLCDWNIIEVTVSDNRYGELFIGYSINEMIGRLSTKIVHLDLELMTGKTISGSTYKLIGEPGLPHDDAIYILEQKPGAEAVLRELFSDNDSGGIKFKLPI